MRTQNKKNSTARTVLTLAILLGISATIMLVLVFGVGVENLDFGRR